MKRSQTFLLLLKVNFKVWQRAYHIKERTGIQMLFILSLFTAVSGCMRLGIGLKDLTKGKILRVLLRVHPQG